MLDLAAGDRVEIVQNQTRHQTITVTSASTLLGVIVTITGRADRGSTFEIPAHNSSVTITLIPGPVQGVDQTARDSATDNALAIAANTTAIAAIPTAVIWARENNGQIIPTVKLPRSVAITGDAVNINSNRWEGIAIGGSLVEIRNGIIKIYRRISGGPPYFSLLGSTTTASVTAGSTLTRYSIALPTYSFQTATQIGGSTGQIDLSGVYPAGLTLAGLNGAMRTAVIRHDFQAATTAEFGNVLADYSETEMWGYHAMGSFNEVRLVFSESAITLTIATDTALAANQQDGWRIFLNVVTF